ncbi:MAG: hypothetical protein M3N16_04595, partial [Actinomycetota bacterium]|nr:hypothetical protein [Actinomycetota bacterium]
MTSTGQSTSGTAVDQFALTDEEALVLSASKLWLMREDIALDPDGEDRRRKRPVAAAYMAALHRSFEREREDGEAPEPTTAGVIARLEKPGWPASVRRSLGRADRPDAERVLAHWSVVQGLLGQVTRRERAVLLAVELAAFYPWPEGLRYEKGVRERKLGEIVEAMAAPITVAYFRELDRELQRRARKLALKRTDWRRVAAIATGGAALGWLTGGLA